MAAAVLARTEALLEEQQHGVMGAVEEEERKAGVAGKARSDVVSSTIYFGHSFTAHPLLHNVPSYCHAHQRQSCGVCMMHQLTFAAGFAEAQETLEEVSKAKGAIDEEKAGLTQ